MPFTSGWNHTARDERLEDLAWMADTGENGTGAAERLGMKYATLQKWCERHDIDLWRRLAARDPRDPHYRSDAPGGLYRRAS